MSTTTYYQVWLSAENKKQAHAILKTIVKQKCMIGGTILQGPSLFWWKGKQIRMNYCYIIGFTTNTQKRKLISIFEKNSKEEIPMIAFNKIQANAVFKKYISSI